MLQYRVASAVFRGTLPPVVKRPALCAADAVAEANRNDYGYLHFLPGSDRERILHLAFR
jgi:hypothetical protein